MKHTTKKPLLPVLILLGVTTYAAITYGDINKPHPQARQHPQSKTFTFGSYLRQNFFSNTATHPLVAAARTQIGVTVSYNPAYVRLDYPNGDVDKRTGVCTDVVVRAYRTLGADLQELVHTDMKANWQAYPKLWGLTRPDANIDHRRVPNLEVFFKRHGETLTTSKQAKDYRVEDFRAGDIVTWRFNPPRGLPHIGIVSDKTTLRGTPLILHNIGRGTEESDILFRYHISGHFRYKP